MQPPDDSPTDEQLARCWQASRDRDALVQLSERYLPQFYRTASALMYGSLDAEDMAHEAVLKVVRKLDAFNPQCSFRNWSYTILLNTIRNDRRQRQVHNKHLAAGVDVSQAAATDAQRQMSPEARSCVATALTKLTDKQRTAIVLTLMEGLPAASVAQMQQCSVDAVYQRVCEARKILRNELNLQQVWRGEK